MKRLFVLFAAMLTVTCISAQRMGGMGMMGGGMPMGMMGGMGMMGSQQTPFYEAESDSIVQARLYDLPFFLDTKSTEKFSKLVKQEYEEVCNIMQSTVIRYLITNQMAANGGGFGGFSIEPEALDQDAIHKDVDKITAKYAKKYKKILDEDQMKQWTELQDKQYGRGLGYLLAHVYDNTSVNF